MTKPRPVGRPPRGKKASTKQVAIRMTEAEYRTLCARAAAAEVTASEFIRLAVRIYG